MDELKAKIQERKERTGRLLADPEVLEIICGHISNGGTAIDLAQTWDIRYSDIVNWINQDKERERRYRLALNARGEWGEERILKELRTLGFTDLSLAYDDNGKLKLPKDMPPEIRAAIAGIDVVEEFITVDGKPEVVGQTKKLKLVDKLKAIELLGKTQRMFVDRTENSTIVSLEDLVVGSFDKADEGESSGGSQA